MNPSVVFLICLVLENLKCAGSFKTRCEWLRLDSCFERNDASRGSD